LQRDGSLWAWGFNAVGQFGLGDDEDRDRPMRAGDDSDWAALAPGFAHSLALKRDGSLWAWGHSDHGQLGLGDREDRDRPTRVGGESDWARVATTIEHTLAPKCDGSLWACGNNSLGQRTDRAERRIDAQEGSAEQPQADLKPITLLRKHRASVASLRC